MLGIPISILSMMKLDSHLLNRMRGEGSVSSFYLLGFLADNYEEYQCKEFI